MKVNFMKTKTPGSILPIALMSSVFSVFAGGKQECTGPIKIGMYADLSAATAQLGQDAEKGGNEHIRNALYTVKCIRSVSCQGF